jgi:hypothetical protein
MDSEWVALIELVAERGSEGMAGVEDRLTGVFLRGDGQNDDLLSGDARR